MSDYKLLDYKLPRLLAAVCEMYDELDEAGWCLNQCAHEDYNDVDRVLYRVQKFLNFIDGEDENHERWI